MKIALLLINFLPTKQKKKYFSKFLAFERGRFKKINEIDLFIFFSSQKYTTISFLLSFTPLPQITKSCFRFCVVVQFKNERVNYTLNLVQQSLF